MEHTALLVSAFTGKPYSAAQLMGEGAEEMATREADAEAHLAGLQERIREVNQKQLEGGR